MLEDNKKPKREGVLLAVPADEGKVERLSSEGWFYGQRKLNGERCRVENFHGTPLFMSSYKNPFSFLDQLKEEVQYIWKKSGVNIPFDGEIYKHGWSRERIDSALRRKVNYNKDVEELEFHVFDVNLPCPQGERIELYQHCLKKFPTDHIKPVECYKLDKNNWMIAADIFLSEGYEGAILRNPFAPAYDPRRTVGQMLKYKPTETDEYEIIGVLEAISQEGEPKGMVGSFIVQGDDEVSFRVGAGKLKHFEREQLFQGRDRLIGKTLVVKQGKILTTEGKPTCAVAVRIKEET